MALKITVIIHIKSIFLSINRCKTYASDPERLNAIIDPDEKTDAKDVLPFDDHSDKDGLWGKSLEGLPHSFGDGAIYEHLGKSEKHRVAGYNMFKCGKVKHIQARELADSFEVKG